MSVTATKTKDQDQSTTIKRGELTKYFRDHFSKYPKQLAERGNASVLVKYREDFNLPEGFEVPKNVISSLNNIKTTLKKDSHSTKTKSNGKNGSVHNGNGTIHAETSSLVSNGQVSVKNYLNQLQSTLDSMKCMFS